MLDGQDMGVYTDLLRVLSDSGWHSVSEIAHAIKSRPRPVLSRLYVLLSQGRVLWKPSRLPGVPEEMLFQASNLPAPGGYPPEPLGREIDEALKRVVGGSYYYSGVAARFLYNLIDRFANLNLVEVHVPESLYRGAVESLNGNVSGTYIIVPDSMPWRLVNRAMTTASVIRVVPHYRPELRASFCGRNVQSIASLLEEIKASSSPSEFKKAAGMALDQGLITANQLEKATRKDPVAQGAFVT